VAFFLFLSLSIYIGFIVYIIAGLFRYNDTNNEDNIEKTVTIVIAARNEENNLEALLNDIANQDYPKNLLDIVIVDDRSTDSTWEIISQFSKNYSFISGLQISDLSNEMTPKKYALTQAINTSSGEVILTTDADCRVPKTWVSSMVNSLGNENVIVVGYSRIDASSKSWFHQLQSLDFLGIMAANAGVAAWGLSWSGSGQNLAYLRSAFEKIDGFNPVSNHISGDDMYLVQAISKIGDSVFNIDPKGAVKTESVDTVEQFINQRSRWASNSKKLPNNNPSFFLFLVTAFLSNIFILVSFFFGLGSFFTAFLIKSIFEGAVFFLGGRLLKTPFTFFIFFVWAFIQPFYIPAIAIMGLNDKFKWKP